MANDRKQVRVAAISPDGAEKAAAKLRDQMRASAVSRGIRYTSFGISVGLAGISLALPPSPVTAYSVMAATTTGAAAWEGFNEKQEAKAKVHALEVYAGSMANIMRNLEYHDAKNPGSNRLQDFASHIERLEAANGKAGELGTNPYLATIDPEASRAEISQQIYQQLMAPEAFQHIKDIARDWRANNTAQRNYEAIGELER